MNCLRKNTFCGKKPHLNIKFFTTKSIKRKVNKSNCCLLNYSSRSYSSLTSDCFKKHYFSKSLPIISIDNQIRNSSSGVISDYSSNAIFDKIVENLQFEIFKGVSESFIIKEIENYIISIHTNTGLPWWATIVCTAFIFRGLFIFPCAVTFTHTKGRLEKVQTIADKIEKQCRKEMDIAIKEFGWTKDKAKLEFNKTMSLEYERLYAENNVFPTKYLPYQAFQPAIWAGVTVALNNICTTSATKTTATIDLANGGFGWIDNLVFSDPYYIIPVTYTLVNLANIKATILFEKDDPVRRSVKITAFCAALASLSLGAVSAFAPTALSLYWLTSSSFGLVQTFLLKSPKLKNLIGTPIVDPRFNHPYRYVYDKLRKKP